MQYDFSRCIIINTSNLYQQEILGAFQSNVGCNEISELFKQINLISSRRDGFSPELLARMMVIPFGPIPKGESYQKLVGIKFRNFCSQLKQELRCKEVELECEDLILSALEDRLYGEGVDIRRLSAYFDDIKAVIYRSSQELGPLQSKKITFSFSQGAPCIRLSTFIEQWGVYHPTGIPLLAFP